MEIGWIRATGADVLSQRDVQAIVAKADEYGLRQAFIPGLHAREIEDLSPTKHLKIAVNGKDFVGRSPRDMADTMRRLSHRWHDRLVVAMPAVMTTRDRTTNQMIETLFVSTPASPYCAADYGDEYKAEVLATCGSRVAPDMRRAAGNGFHALSPCWQSACRVARCWTDIVIGATHAGRRARHSHWHVARCIFVSDDPGEVAAYRAKLAEPFLRRHGSGAADASDLIIAGTASDVVRQLKQFRAQVGPFGVLHSVDPGLPPAKALKQIDVLANVVVPRLSGAAPAARKEMEAS